MSKEKNIVPEFDDIVFEKRNKEYGAYAIRKKYNRTVIFALLIGIVIIATAIITPYLNAKAMENKNKRTEREVQIQMENLDQPTEAVAPPPPPPPPPTDVVQQQRYVPPEVVDTIKPEEMVTLMTADEAKEEVQNEEVVDYVEEVQEEIQEEKEPEPFIVVEEMPMFPGGDAELLKYINEHTEYPESAIENNIQGKVIVKFCVNADGTIGKVNVLRPVDPELDAEAIRVVSGLPKFRPGRQGGQPVPVWYMVPISFTLR